MGGIIVGILAALSVGIGGACGGEFSASSVEDASARDSTVQQGPDASAGSGGAGGTSSTQSSSSSGGAGGATTSKDAAGPAMDVAIGGGAGVPNVDASDSGSTGQDVVSNASGIFCGSTSCDPASQVCCAEIGALDPGSNLPLRCVPKGMCSGMSPMNIPCDDHADCAKAQPTLPVCCVGTSRGAPSGRFVLVGCTTPTGCTTTTDVRNEVMCSGVNDRESCPAGKVCRAGLLRDGYFTCQ